MPVLPVPIIISLLLLGLLLYRFFLRRIDWMLFVLIGVCGVQSALIGMVHYYEIASLRLLQPVLASIIPAVAWLALRYARYGRITRWEFVVHSSGFFVALAIIFFFPEGLDFLIPFLFAAYGLGMMGVLVGGENILPHSRLENGGLPVLVWRLLAFSLISSAFVDVIIAYNLAHGNDAVLLWLPSLFSSLFMLVLGALGLNYAIESRVEPSGAKSSMPSGDVAQFEEIITALDRYVADHKPYLDPDLTLAKLSRKLKVPEKRLSSAINMQKGRNVSRYINEHRIAHACGMLKDGMSVTEAMLLSGFNTKSNFNREFQRVKGMSPRQWAQTF